MDRFIDKWGKRLLVFAFLYFFVWGLGWYEMKKHFGPEIDDALKDFSLSEAVFGNSEKVQP